MSENRNEPIRKNKAGKPVRFRMPTAVPKEDDAPAESTAPVSEDTSAPKEALKEEKVSAPKETPAEEKVSESNKASIEEKTSESKKASAEEKVSEPKKASVEEKVSEPKKASVEEKASEPKKASVEEKASEPKKALSEEKVSEPKKAPAEEKASKPRRILVEEKGAHAKKTLFGEKPAESKDTLVTEQKTESNEALAEAEIPQSKQAPAKEEVPPPTKKKDFRLKSPFQSKKETAPADESSKPAAEPSKKKDKASKKPVKHRVLTQPPEQRKEAINNWQITEEPKQEAEQEESKLPDIQLDVPEDLNELTFSADSETIEAPEPEAVPEEPVYMPPEDTVEEVEQLDAPDQSDESQGTALDDEVTNLRFQRTPMTLSIPGLDDETDEDYIPFVGQTDDEEPEDEEEEEVEEEPRKRRKKKKKISVLGVIVRVILALALLCALAFGAMGIIYASGDILGLKESEENKEILIEPNSTVSDVADLLKENGVIDYPPIFKLYIKYQLDDHVNFKYGTVMLNPSMSYAEIIDALEQNVEDNTAVSVTIHEGENMVEIADALQAAGVCKKEEFLNAVNNHQFKYEFLSGINNPSERMYRLEGYLFPNTYEFLPNTDPDEVICKFLDELDYQIDSSMWTQMDIRGLDLDTVLRVASMVQAEAPNKRDMAKVSSVFWNRLNDSANYPLLQSDPTSKYAQRVLAANGASEAMVTAYDTYKSNGLPPGPINNPGAEAIHAALYPQTTDYYFFCSNLETGEFYYAATLDEHDANLGLAGLA